MIIVIVLTNRWRHYICLMLNYILVDNYGSFKADHIFDITKVHIDEFIQKYAITKLSNGKYRSKQSVEKCTDAVIKFFVNLIKKYDGYMLLIHRDLLIEKNVLTKRGKIEKVYSPNFHIRIMPSHKTIFRDIPTKVFEILLNQAFINAKDIAFAICLQAFAGLRPSEALSVRQEHSPLGNGMTLTVNENTLSKVEIDCKRQISRHLYREYPI